MDGSYYFGGDPPVHQPAYLYGGDPILAAHSILWYGFDIGGRKRKRKEEEKELTIREIILSYVEEHQRGHAEVETLTNNLVQPVSRRMPKSEPLVSERALHEIRVIIAEEMTNLIRHRRRITEELMLLM